jgi:quercetin dioxygenase-like cupin family protein
MQAKGARVLGPRDGRAGLLGSMGVRFMLAGAETGGGFSLVEHPIPPRALAAPLHRHSREDEYSFVLEGRLGALLGDEVVFGEPGDLIFKPRGQWHTFWNAGDESARILEMISPAGFERYFEQMVELLEMSAGAPDPSELGAIAARHGLAVDPESHTSSPRPVRKRVRPAPNEPVPSTANARRPAACCSTSSSACAYPSPLAATVASNTIAPLITCTTAKACESRCGSTPTM